MVWIQREAVVCDRCKKRPGKEEEFTLGDQHYKINLCYKCLPLLYKSMHLWMIIAKPVAAPHDKIPATLQVDESTKKRFRELIGLLRETRRAAELTQRTVAERIGVDVRSVADWEADRDDPTMFHFIQLAREVGFRLEIEDRLGRPVLSNISLNDSEPFEQYEMRRLAEALRRRRIARDMSPKALAALVGVSKTSIYRWEKAQPFPRPIAFLVWMRPLEYAVKLRVAPESGWADRWR